MSLSILFSLMTIVMFDPSMTFVAESVNGNFERRGKFDAGNKKAGLEGRAINRAARVTTVTP
jgi:hypothetical protein